ncbi:unnamed protein product [Rotaria magnacalcarata]|uniref:Uncharacterized protein n=1 Tax=Rotaria magnacalcarata TaxID=392030 RepID=A0A820FX86_9BILA|nr:unnamed protein product [Rotaria magnacalcarata]
MQRLRQRLQLTVDPRLSNPLGQVTYDGLREETIDIDLSYQKRVDEKSMSLNLKVNVPQKSLISIKYDETIRSNTSFTGVLKYSFNANDSERTNLTIDIDPVAHKKKFIVDLNRFTGERIGYETAMNFAIGELETTYYTLVTSWNMKYRVGVLPTIIVTQKDQEVLRITDSTGDLDGYKIRFLPANIELKNQLDSYILISVSQALGKIGPRNGLFGLETVKKSFRLQIGNAPLTVYNVQQWKTHFENIQLPESYSIRSGNDANGNSVQLATNKWNENRLISTISHSLDGGKTQTTDLKLDRNYAYQVGSIYFLHSQGYRNVQAVKQLRNSTRQFICEHLAKDLNKANFDYAALIEIFTAWSKEPENSFLRKLTTRLGLLEVFTKYPAYTDASDRISAILGERHVQRGEFWRSRIENILNNNRRKDLSQRFQTRRMEIIQSLLSASEKVFDRFLPKIDQKSDDNKWFRVLVAAAADVELTKVFKKLGDSSKLLISNIQQISQRMNQRRESIRERVQNAIRHLPKASMNDTNSEILYPIGRRPGTYSETSKHYSKAVHTFVKRLWKRNPALTPEFSAVIANTGDTIDLHGDYVLAHDFGGLQFSFRFIYGKVYSVLPNLVEIKENECSTTGRV